MANCHRKPHTGATLISSVTCRTETVTGSRAKLSKTSPQDFIYLGRPLDFRGFVFSRCCRLLGGGFLSVVSQFIPFTLHTRANPTVWNFLIYSPDPFHKKIGVYSRCFSTPSMSYLRHCLHAAKTSALLAQGMNHSAAFHTPALCGFARRAIATQTAAKKKHRVGAVAKALFHIATQVSVFSPRARPAPFTSDPPQSAHVSRSSVQYS